MQKKFKATDTTVEYIKPSVMNVDLSYQRNAMARKKKIESIAKNFDPRRLGLIHVCRRPDKSVWVLDGAGRLAAMKIVGYDEPVKCEVHHHIKSVEEEADWFLKLNPEEAAKVSTAQKFKARVRSGEKKAIAIQENGAAGGLAVCGTGRNGISIQAATCIHEGLGNLPQVGAVKTAGWHDVKPSGTMYVALAALLKASDNLNETRLIQVLHKNPPDVVDRKTRAEYGAAKMDHARDQGPRVARTMLNIYNFRATVKKATANWKRINDALVDFYDQWRPMND